MASDTKHDVAGDVVRWLDQWGTGVAVPVLRLGLAILGELAEIRRVATRLDNRVRDALRAAPSQVTEWQPPTELEG